MRPPSLRIAAIRETFEESGILLARPKGSKALVDAKTASAIEAAHRADLCDSKITFLKVLTDNGMVLALDNCVPYAHWITPEGMPKRFDTWFFLAAAPPEQVGAHDGKECPRTDLGLAARGAGRRRERPVQAAVPDHAQSDQARQAGGREGGAGRQQGQAGGQRDAGHDQTQRRPPAPEIRSRPATTATCSRSARWGDILDTRRSIGAGLPDRTHINDPSGDWARRREIDGEIVDIAS